MNQASVLLSHKKWKRDMFAIPEREGEADLVLSDKNSRNYGLNQRTPSGAFRRAATQCPR
jgi:hypothetical protein